MWTKILLIGAMLGGIALLAYFNLPRPPVTLPGRADFVLVEKHKHTLTLFRGGQAMATFRVALGRGGLAPKRQEGDGLTPEGRYVIDAHKADSAFHKALHISYPSPADRAAAQARHVDPGDAIMIHGVRNGFGWMGAVHTQIDWTNGCIALSDAEMDAVWTAVADGTPIEIRG